ncbi:MAG: PilT/PilU family type 4a pilus ATPase [bacterium]|nr:PilT/PilU family type 4a pilus ATPase [bacterium]
MELYEILNNSVEQQASDIFFIVGQPVSYKMRGVITKIVEEKLDAEASDRLVRKMYEMAGRDLVNREKGDDDFSLSLSKVGRFRINVFMQRGTWSAVLRVVNFELPDVEKMRIPHSVLDLSKKQKGLVLVTGSAGSGKSTTISYIIEEINKNRNCHILTLEDPIEFLHKHKKGIVSQREMNIDSVSYSRALKAAMRESPDVILIGEMRDLETIEIAMTAAETGHLVLSTLHTVGAANTIDRIVDVFPPNQQQQIRVQLSMVLQSIVSQQLLPSESLGLVPAFEVLMANSAIKTMIRDGKVHQIDTVIHSSAKEHMRSMDASILELYRQNLITEETALTYCMNVESMKRGLK